MENDVEILRSAPGPSPAIRQALEELKKKSPKDINMHYHLALCYYREYPIKSLESLNLINTAEEVKRTSIGHAELEIAADTLAEGTTLQESASQPVRMESRLSAKALLIAAHVSGASVLRRLLNFSTTSEFLNSMLASRAPTPGRFSAEQVTAALLLLRTASSRDPCNLSALNALGILFFQLGQFQDAADTFQALFLETGGTYLDPLVNRGLSLLFLGQHEEASSCFFEVLQKDAQHLEATVNYAVSLFKSKRYEDAVDLLEKACGLYQSEPMLWNNLGAAYATVGLISEAHSCFERVESLRKSSASAAAFFASSPSHLKGDARVECNVGVSLRAGGDLLQAHEQLMRALELDSQNSFAWNSMAKLFDSAAVEMDIPREDGSEADEESLFNKCLHSVSQSLSIDRADATTWNAMGIIYLRRGYFKEATEALRHATTLNPSSAAFRANYALCLHLKLQHFKSSSADPTPDEAAECDELQSTLHQLTTTFSDSFCALNNAGNIYRDIGQLDESLRTFESALSLFPNNSALFNNVALVHLLKGNAAEAGNLFGRALELDGGLQAVSANLKIFQVTNS